jgi:hypothetical protein
MCKFYKNKHYKALPTRKPELFARYNETRHRGSIDEVTTAQTTAQAAAQALASNNM